MTSGTPRLADFDLKCIILIVRQALAREENHALGRSFARTSVITSHRQLIVYAQKEDYCGKGQPNHAAHIYDKAKRFSEART